MTKSPRNRHATVTESVYSPRARRVIMEGHYTKEEVLKILANPEHPEHATVKQQFQQKLDAKKAAATPPAQQEPPKKEEPPKPDEGAIDEEVLRLEDVNAMPYNGKADEARDRYRHSRMSGKSIEQIGKHLLRMGYANNGKTVTGDKMINSALFRMMLKAGMIEDEWIKEWKKNRITRMGTEQDRNNRAAKLEMNQDPRKTASRLKQADGVNVENVDAARKLYLGLRDNGLKDEEIAEKLYKEGYYKDKWYVRSEPRAKRSLFLMMLQAGLIPHEFRIDDEMADDANEIE